MSSMDYVRAAQPRVVALFLVTVLAAMLLCGSPAVWRAAGRPRGDGAHRRRRGHAQQRHRARRGPAHGADAPASHGLRPHPAGARHARRAGRRGRRGSGPLGRRRRPRRGLRAARRVLLRRLYTLLLKPRTALSAVPGGVAGVFPALIGWAATGAAWSGAILFLCVLIPVWSPPHSWALTLALGEDYRASGIPTPPARYGDDATRRLIAGFMVRAHRGAGRAARRRPVRRRLRGRAWSSPSCCSGRSRCACSAGRPRPPPGRCSR